MCEARTTGGGFIDPEVFADQQRAQPPAYGGWRNYPTWAVNLWLSNDEQLYYRTIELAIRRNYRGTPTGTETAHRLAWALKSWIEDELLPDLPASFAADLLGYAVDLVDWRQIADAWLEELAG